MTILLILTPLALAMTLPALVRRALRQGHREAVRLMRRAG